METTFCELRAKEVINIVDGRRMGHIVDIVIDICCGKLLGLVVPGCKKNWFKTNDDLFIPYCNICKIGKDVILVEIFSNTILPNTPYCCTNNVNASTYNVETDGYSYVRDDKDKTKI